MSEVMTGDFSVLMSRNSKGGCTMPHQSLGPGVHSRCVFSSQNQTTQQWAILQMFWRWCVYILIIKAENTRIRGAGEGERAREARRRVRTRERDVKTLKWRYVLCRCQRYSKEMDGTYGGKEIAEGKASIQSKLTKPGRRLNSRLCQRPRQARIYNNLNFLFIECL